MTKQSLKNQERYVNQRIWKAIKEKTEFTLLNFISIDYFDKPIGNFYINYSLDALSEYKILYNSDEKARFKSIKATINLMTIDFFLEKMQKQAKKNKNNIEGKTNK